MKKRVILPFADKPLSVIYQHPGFTMGIIQGNVKEDITPWLCGRHINCIFDINAYNKFSIFIKPYWAGEEGVILTDRIYLFPETYDYLSFNLIEIFRKVINRGFYPFGDYNEEYIKGKNAYKKHYYAHDFILYGYDDIKKVFHSAGYLSDGFFQKCEIPYENMLYSLRTLKHKILILYFWKYNKDTIFSFDLARIETGLEDYLLSVSKQILSAGEKIFGMKAIERLAEYLHNTSEEKGYMDMRYTRGIIEHKYLMRMRIKYLYEKGIVQSEENIKFADEIYQMANMVHMKALKFNVTKDFSNVQMNKEFIFKMNEIESKYLVNVLEEIKAFGK